MKSKNKLELSRYQRQYIFREIGKKGQRKISLGSVAIIGCGGLGTNAANNLVRAGIGKLYLFDEDKVELSNLQRQTLYQEIDALNHKSKVLAAKEKLTLINHNVEIEAIDKKINESNIDDSLGDKEIAVIIDATDNFKSRFIINKFCIKNKIPWIHGAIGGSTGMIYNIIPGITPCFNCLFNNRFYKYDLELTSAVIGCLNTVVNIISSIQVTEAIKILCGKNDALLKNLLLLDIWNNIWEFVEVQKRFDFECEVCGNNFS